MSDTPVGFDPKTIPAEIDRWNWGAFLLNWIWGIGNNTYIALLTFVPFFGFIWMFVHAAFTLLGDVPIKEATSVPPQSEDSEMPETLPARAKVWAKQNGILREQLDAVFQIEGEKVEVIASDVLGSNNKDKTHNAYVITGIAALLSKGEPKFDDDAARTLCKTLGCYNDANHLAYMRDKGNELSGSKERGWTLTAPGLKRGATIVKELTGKTNA